MALYNCTECGTLVSELAEACPHCGAADSGKRSKAVYLQNQKKEEGSGFGGLVGLILFVVVIAGILYVLSNK